MFALSAISSLHMWDLRWDMAQAFGTNPLDEYSPLYIHSHQNELGKSLHTLASSKPDRSSPKSSHKVWLEHLMRLCQ